MKLCINCAHHRLADKCGHEQAVIIDPVRGEKTGRYFCSAMRISPCGPEGKLFEEPTCHSCGATVPPGESTCGSCSEQYRGEERAARQP